MSLLDAFKAKLEEFATNNTSALDGHLQVTFNERENLKLMYDKLAPADRPVALALAKANGIDTASWAPATK